MPEADEPELVKTAIWYTAWATHFSSWLYTYRLQKKIVNAQIWFNRLRITKKCSGNGRYSSYAMYFVYII